MPEALNKPTLRPQFKLSRDEISKLVEDTTGQKPKNGFHSVTLTMQMDGEAGTLTWVDAAERIKSVAPSTKAIPPIKPKSNGKNSNSGPKG